MKAIVLTRRQFLAVTGLATLGAAAPRPWTLENDALRFRLLLANGEVVTRELLHCQASRTHSLPVQEFLLEFDDGSIVASTTLRARPGEANAGTAEFIFSNDAGLEVRVRYSLAPQAHYLRKQISLRQTRVDRRRLVRVDLENWQGIRQRWNSTAQADALKFGSHPIFCDDLWAGVEFVAAFNEFGPDGFILRSRPGGILLGPDWQDLRSTVVGVAVSGRARDAFLRYIDDIRLARPRIIACYNSWWTLPKVVTQADNLALIRQLKAEFFGRHGVFFDVITTDMGWSSPRSIWEIDHTMLPHGFDDIRQIVEPAGGKLGLWMSPSETYPPVCDYEWAGKNGYVVVRSEETAPATQRPRFLKPGVSLADPRYREETKAQLRKLIRENKLAHIKYDGFWPIEHTAHHDLRPGLDSVEPLAAYSLELLQASKAENRDLVTEPTYMNSIHTYISPWILKYSDTVWANGEDSVVGIGPAPDYREAHTNAREAIIFQSLDQVWLPQNAVHYFDIVHVDSPEGFANHTAMAFGRGRFFLSTYLNPKLLNADDWRIYAGFLRWARANTELLRHTVVVPSRVEAGEPYTYAHWLGPRGVLAVRNPSNETREFALDLSRAGAPRELADGICYSQFPHRRGIATKLNATSTVQLTLAPWEVLFLEIMPQAQLRELVILGARWFRTADGNVSIAADRDAGKVRVLGPNGLDRTVEVTPRSIVQPTGEIVSRSARPLPETSGLRAKPRTGASFTFHYPANPDAETIRSLRESAWKDAKWKTVPGVSFELECAVSIPAGHTSARVLLLVEFPGREHRPSQCAATIDGASAALEQRDSADHVGYYNWTGSFQSAESEWTWYICAVPQGSHRVEWTGVAGHPNPRFGLWIWADSDLAAAERPLPGLQCTEAALPPYRDRNERDGICLMRPTPARA